MKSFVLLSSIVLASASHEPMPYGYQPQRPYEANPYRQNPYYQQRNYGYQEPAYIAPQYAPQPQPYARPEPNPYARPEAPAYAKPEAPAYARPEALAYARPEAPAYARPKAPAYARPEAPTAYAHPNAYQTAYQNPAYQTPAYARPAAYQSPAAYQQPHRPAYQQPRPHAAPQKPKAVKPEPPMEEEEPMYLGSFQKTTHGVKGDIFMLDDETLYIQGFSFDGQAPDVVFFYEGIAIPYFTRSSPGQMKENVVKFSGEDVVLKLPAQIRSIKNLEYLKVWCRQFNMNFGELNMH